VNELAASDRVRSTTSGRKEILGISLARAGLDGTDPSIRRPGLLVAVLLAASFLTACSGGSPQPTPQGSSPASSAVAGASPSPTSHITPGHSTPQEAVEGFVQAVVPGNWTLACSYASPDTQQACFQSNANFGPNSGQAISIDGADINGDHALVEVTGTVCNKLVGCVSNLIPSSGMPTGPSDFQASYDAALPSAPHRIKLIISPIPMIKVNGQWYVNYG
jgi:hypothetical protein